MKFRYRAWTILLSMLVIASACGRQSGPTGTAPAEIRIGAVLPLTGDESKPGNYQKLGYELAVSEVNADGGLLVKAFDKKIPVKLEVLDDETNQTKTVSLLERLASDKSVVALLGGYSTTLVKAQAVVPDRYQKPYVNGGGAASDIYAQGYKYVFGTLSPITMLGEVTMKFLADQADKGALKKGSTVAIAWENTSHGKDYDKGIKGWVEKNPGYFKVVFSESFELYGSDYGPLLTKVNNAKADIFLADTHLEDYITMHRQYTQLGMKHKMISYGARGPEKDAKAALGGATDYVFAGVWWHRDLPYPQSKEFITAYESFTEKQGQKISPEWYSATAYEAARALFRAMESAGKLEGLAIRDSLAKLRLEKSVLPTEVLDFPDNGQMTVGFLIVQNKPGGKTEIVYPAETSTGKPVAPIP